jgi:hypothetical protein
MHAAARVSLVGQQPDGDPPNLPMPTPGPADPMPDSYWQAVLSDPRAAARPGVPIANRRLG